MMRNLFAATLALVTVMAWPLATLAAGPGGCDGVANRSASRDEGDRPRNSVNLSPEQRNNECGQRDRQAADRDDDRSRSRSTDIVTEPVIGATDPADTRVRTRRPDRDGQRIRDRSVEPSADSRTRSRERDMSRDPDRDLDRTPDRTRDRDRRDDVGTPAGAVGDQPAAGGVPLFPKADKPAKSVKPTGPAR